MPTKKIKNKKVSKKAISSNRSLPLLQWIAIVGVLLITFLAFLPSLQNDFVNWDDDKNFYENSQVTTSTDLSSLVQNTPAIFSSQVIGNYNPLPIWTFAVENMVYGTERPFYWHLSNLLLHLLCVFLVFRFSTILGLNMWGAIICALLFAIHPLRVESVAWVTERKDVLFAAFYFAALVLYGKAIKARSPKKYRIPIIILFVLSGLSKIQAVSLPLSLLAVDYFLGRPIKWKRLVEKWIYFLISVAIGLAGIYFLRQNGSLDIDIDYPLYDRLFVGSFAYTVYLIKVLVPYEMLALYPYPPKLELIHYLSLIPVLIAVAFAIYAYLREWKAVFFGFLFFTFNIFFVLQIVGAGQGFQADRFTYVAYFGLFFTLTYYLQKLSSRKSASLFVNLAVAVFLITMAYMTYEQCKVWRNSSTLWTHVIEKHPNTPLPWTNRANFNRDNGLDRQALYDYNKAIKLDDNKPSVFNSRAKLYFKSNNRDTLQLALSDYNRAITLDPDNGGYLMNRGATYSRLGNPEGAIVDLTKAGGLEPDNASIWFNRSIVFHILGQYQNEIDDIHHYMGMKTATQNMWGNLANAQMLLRRWPESFESINKAISLDPKQGLFYFFRAKYYFNNNNFGAAQQDLDKARSMGFQHNGGIETLRM